jgi:hypothetical protein
MIDGQYYHSSGATAAEFYPYFDEIVNGGEPFKVKFVLGRWNKTVVHKAILIR